MQYQGPAKLVHDDASVLFVFYADVASVVGTFTVGESLTFSGGATGVCTSYAAGLLGFGIAGNTRPYADEDVEGDSSGATATISSFDLEPSLIDFGIDDNDFFIREGDHPGYLVADVPQAWRLELTAPYRGSSANEADCILHNTATSNDLPLLDRRDREFAALITRAFQIIDEKINEFDERLDDLES